MSRSQEYPANLSHLERLITGWSRSQQVSAGRLRRTVMVGVVLSMLVEHDPAVGQGRFVVKGGTALELRFGWKSRASIRDVAVGDLRPRGELGAVTDLLRLRPLDPVRLTQIDEVECLCVEYQIAQKLHACTDPLDGARENDRVRDLADLLLLEALMPADELFQVRAACIEIFGTRRTHPWPPRISVGSSWRSTWQRLVANGEAPYEDLGDAVGAVEDLILRIDDAV